jgi:hypothetical protein
MLEDMYELLSRESARTVLSTTPPTAYWVDRNSFLLHSALLRKETGREQQRIERALQDLKFSTWPPATVEELTKLALCGNDPQYVVYYHGSLDQKSLLGSLKIILRENDIPVD